VTIRALFIPERPWESVSMDFIVGLTTSEECNWVLVIVDQYLSIPPSFPVPKECFVEHAVYLFFKYMVKYWGLPQSMVSNWDIRFT